MSPDDPVMIEQIKQLKARYFRAMDMRDWTAFGHAFSNEGSLEVESIRRDDEGDRPISRKEMGRDAIVAWVSGVLAGATTIHHGHMPEIEILSPTRASGIWAMEDRVIWPDRSLHGWGHYHESYIVEDGAWRIAASRLTRLHVEIHQETGAPQGDRPAMLDMKA